MSGNKGCWKAKVISVKGRFVLMTETIKVEVNEALANKFRKRAMELYGYKKGSMKRALEDTMKRFSTPGRVDWHSIRGALKNTKISSVELQHKTWSKVD
jgi:hypothetical protein